MTYTVVFLNGPPSCGKDTIGKYLAENLDGKFSTDIKEFKEPLYQHTAELFNVDLTWFKLVATNRVTKERPLRKLKGFSPRKTLIFTSEEVYKKIHGKDYFGKCVADSLKSHAVTFITDSGFIEEAEAVVNKVGAKNCLLVNLERYGTSFDNDSRSYINMDHLGVKRIVVQNNGIVVDACKIINDSLMEVMQNE